MAVTVFKEVMWHTFFFVICFGFHNWHFVPPIWQTVLGDSEFILNLNDGLSLKWVTQPNFPVMIFLILLLNMHWILMSSVDGTFISCGLPSLISKARSVQLWICGKVKVLGLRKHHPNRSLEGIFSSQFLQDSGNLKEDLFPFYYLYCLDQGLAKSKLAR